MTAQASGTSGQQITINWTVQNQGAFEAGPSWLDAVYLSADTTFDPATDTPLGTVFHSSRLGPGLSYNASATVTLPGCTSGTNYLFVLADKGNQIFEFDPNYDAEGNNFNQPRAIQITLALPDLQVAAVSNPQSGTAGQPLTVSWTVANQGTGQTGADTWVDRVYLNPSPEFNTNTALLLKSFSRSGILAPNSSYTRTEDVIIPTTAQGTYYVFVVTDALDAVEECANNGNNTRAGTDTLNVSNALPDLRIASVSAPDNAYTGQTVTVQWVVNNAGTAAAQTPAWDDAVYFSTNITLDSEDRKLATAIHNSALAVGSSYPAQAQVTLPVVAAGTYYLIVKTDDNGRYVFEGQHEDNNTGQTAIHVVIPDVDLQMTSLTVPGEFFSGHEMPVSWTITNAGTVPTFASAWTDYVLLSRDQILDPTDRVIGYQVHKGGLNGSASYSTTLNVTVPPGLAGQYYVFVRADFHNGVAETNETNNVSSPREVSLQLPPPVDLTVAAINAPASASPGELFTLEWTGKNTGSNTATGNWTDAIYLSTDLAWDSGDALIGRVDHAGPLAPGETYTGVLAAPLPAVDLGQYHVIVRTDVRNRVREVDETNNVTTNTATTIVDVTELPLGMPHYSTLRTGQERYFKTNVPGNETVLYTLDAERNDSVTELYARQGAMVSQSAYDFFFNRPNEADQEIVVPNTLAGSYYSLARGAYVPPDAGGSTPFTIKAEIIPFSIRSVSPNKGGNTGQVTVRLEGAKFDQFTEVELIRGEHRVKPVWMEISNSTRIHATFDLAGLLPGYYNVRAWSEQTIWDVDPTTGKIFTRKVVYGDHTFSEKFEVVKGGGPVKKAQLLLPSSARFSSRFSFLIEIANEGDTDTPTPVLLVFSPNGTPLSTSPSVPNGSGYQEQVVVLGERRRTVLAPGERIIVPLYAKAIREPSSQFVLQDLTASALPLDWDSLESYYHDGSNPTEWSATWANFKAIVGDTWNELHQVIRKMADDKALGTTDRFYTGSQIINELIARARSGQNDPDDFLSGSSNREYGSDFSGSVRPNSVSVKRDPLPDEDQCKPIADPSVLKEVERSFREGDVDFPGPTDIGLPHLRRWFGSQVGDLWKLYVDYGAYNEGPPRSGIVVAPYRDGDEIVEKSNALTKGFRKSKTTQKHIKYLLNRIKEKLKKICPNLPANRPVSYTLKELIPAELTQNRMREKLNFSYITEIPGNIAGGMDLEENPPDGRSVTGTVILKKHVSRCGKFLYLEILPTLTYTINDTINFCPGNPGREDSEQYLTIPLRRLEKSGEAHDVGINVIFTERPKPTIALPFDLEVSTILLPYEVEDGSCNTQIACPIQPPTNPCAAPCDDCSDNPPPVPTPDCPRGEPVPTNRPRDPNDKIGPTGFGPQLFIGSQQSLPYTINFENVATATGAAQRIRITDQLDPNLDWRTFRLKEIGFGNYRIQVPENRAAYQTRIQLGSDLGNLLANVSAGVNIATGQVTWTLTAIDPATGEQPNGALQGLLLPNDSTGRGQGFITYTVKPKPTAPTGAQINNNAIITFDTEEPIITNTVTNTLDTATPSSAVNPLTATSPQEFTLSWAGDDGVGGSGIQSYDIWVAKDDGTYQPFLSGTTEKSTPFTGQLGRTYRFYSIARDNAGNVESPPAVPDATVTVAQEQNPVPMLTKLNPDSTMAGSPELTLTVSGNNFINTSTVQWNGTPRTTTFVSATELRAVITANDVAVGGTASVIVVNSAPGGGSSNPLTFTINLPPATYTISGQVIVGNNNGLGGVTMTLSGSQSATAQTDANGSYSFANLPTGSYTVTPSKTNYTFNPPNLTFNGLSSNQATTFIAIQTPPLPILISEETSTRAIALDSVLWLRDPFRLDSPVPWGPDRRTRVMLFAMNFDLQPGEDISVVTADAEDASHRIYPLTVEYVDKVPGFDWLSCVIVRLNDDMGDVGDVLVRINVRGVSSNRVRVGIGHIGGGPPDDPGAVPTPGRQP